MTPKIKKEPVDENDNMALVKMESAPHPDEYLKSAYENHLREEHEKAVKAGKFNGVVGRGMFGNSFMEHTNPGKIVCSNCDAEDHEARECPHPKDYSCFQCSSCQEMGHTKAICKKGIVGDEGSAGFGGRVKEEKRRDGVGEGRAMGGVINGNRSAIEVRARFSGAKNDEDGKNSFLESQIQKLEKKLEDARLREAEKNVQIGNLQAQVGFLRDTPTETSFAISGSTTSSQFESYSQLGSPVAAHAQPIKAESSRANPMIDVREQIRGNRVQVNNGYQASGPQAQNSTPVGAHVNQAERDRQLHSVNHRKIHRPRVKQADKIPSLKEVIANERREAMRAQQQKDNDLEADMFHHQVGDAPDVHLYPDVLEAARNLQRAGSTQQTHIKSVTQENSQLGAKVQSNDQVLPDGASVDALQATVALAVDPTKKQMLDVAAISFSSQLAVKLMNLKDALNINSLDIWFDRQIAHNFKCSQELNFNKMVTSYKDFIDWIGVQLEKKSVAKLEEENVNSALKECENMVQTLMDVESIIAAYDLS